MNDKIMQMVDQISRNESIKGSDHTSKWNFLFDSMVFTYFKPNHRSNAYTHTHDKKKEMKDEKRSKPSHSLDEQIVLRRMHGKRKYLKFTAATTTTTINDQQQQQLQ